MKKNFKRIAGVSLAAVMALSTFAGCGSGGDGEEGSDGKKSVTLTLAVTRADFRHQESFRIWQKNLKQRQESKLTSRYLRMLSGVI